MSSLRWNPKSKSSSSSSSPSSAESSCNVSCLPLLQQVLLDPHSRPHRLLQSMGSTLNWRPVPNGVEVEIPAQQVSLQKRWSRLHPPEKVPTDEPQPITALLFQGTPTVAAAAQLATSAAPAAASALTAPSSLNAPASTEWLYVSCKKCSSTGPEGGARAFVMGPTPLSVVVCNNRLVHHSQHEMEEILTHELIHVYDVRELQLDLKDCESLAYSEVRAARHAECANAWHLQGCVRLKAWTATSNLFPEMASRCLRKVLDKAMKDQRPFSNDDAMYSNKKQASSPRSSSR